MGKQQAALTKEQKLVLKVAGGDEFIKSCFYFTGGTALNVVYLHHRKSLDLDFFSEKSFDQLSILNKVTTWSREYKFRISPQVVETTSIFNLTFPHQKTLRVDFSHYPYRRLEKGKQIYEIEVDSLADIATNKLVSINQRTEVKDFVDFYFLLKQFAVWDVLEMVKVKFNLELDPINTAADFLKVEEFEFLPEMLVPLKLQELKNFYRDLARKLGLAAVQK